MSKSKTRTFCLHCASIVPAGQECACRKRKRRATANDATRGEREPWRGNYEYWSSVIPDDGFTLRLDGITTSV